MTSGKEENVEEMRRGRRRMKMRRMCTKEERMKRRKNRKDVENN